jgi:hypothetical protein
VTSGRFTDYPFDNYEFDITIILAEKNDASINDTDLSITVKSRVIYGFKFSASKKPIQEFNGKLKI